MLELQPFVLTFEMALITSVILLAMGVPLAYWLSVSRFRSKVVLEALLSLPLVLPPSVLGFYLLMLLSPSNAFGRFLDSYFDLQLVFTFEGLIVASLFYSVPFMVQPLLSGFRSLPPVLSEASYTLGKGRLTTLVRVLLPNMKASILTAFILTFAHTIGEFGVVLMVGGNIPGETRVLSVVIYDEVEAMNYDVAHQYAAILLVVSFILLLSIYLFTHWLNRKATTYA